MQIRLKMRFSCASRQLRNFDERQAARPNSANAPTSLAFPEIHSLPLPSVFLALAESTISAIYVSGLTKLATSADCPKLSRHWGCWMDEIHGSTLGNEIDRLHAEHHRYAHRLEELLQKPYLTEDEQLEEVRLKKLKLHAKDLIFALERRQLAVA
jgi:hypothetical protein